MAFIPHSQQIDICGNSVLTDASKKAHRQSNLELFRIIVMLLIIAHHYVVNSGLFEILKDSDSESSIAMLIFGAWGKTGINCFVLITGYFMCRSSFSWQKLMKLYLQIVFYAVIIYLLFCISGHETFSVLKTIRKLFPINSIASGFVSCFLIFYLLIPFLNVLVKNIDKRQHLILTAIMIITYSIFPMLHIQVTFNYISWFCILYLVASLVRIHGIGDNLSRKFWGYTSATCLILGVLSIIAMHNIYKLQYASVWNPYFFISDSNKILSLAIAFSSFMWFKSLRIRYSTIINTIGASTFGVLLIHANSDAMRQWLWNETIDCVGHINDSSILTLGYAVLSVATIFTVCSIIEYGRNRFIESSLCNKATSFYRFTKKSDIINNIFNSISNG